MNRANSQTGFSLIELLVALLITAIGMMGMLALQVRAQQAQFEAYQRGQAMLLIEDIVNRMTTNVAARRCYEITTNANGTPFAGISGTANLTCPGGFGTVATRTTATSDLTAWDGMLKGQGETLGGANVGGLVGARGCISYTPVGGQDQFTVAISWQGQYDTIVPATSCANNQYGNETQRRTVSVTVEFADLT